MVEPGNCNSVKQADTRIAMAPLAVTFTEDEIDDIDGELRRPLHTNRARNSPSAARPRITTTQQQRRHPESIPLVGGQSGRQPATNATLASK